MALWNLKELSNCKHTCQNIGGYFAASDVLNLVQEAHDFMLNAGFKKKMPSNENSLLLC